jgi:O-antigen ligase
MSSLRTNIAVVSVWCAAVIFYFLIEREFSPDILAILCFVATLVAAWFDIRWMLVGWFIMAPYFLPYPTGDEALGINYAPNLSHYQFIPLFFLLFVAKSVVSGKKLSIGKDEIFLLAFVVYAIVSSMIVTDGRYADVRRVYVNYGLGLFLYFIVKNTELDLRFLKILGFAALFHVAALLCIGLFEYKTGFSFYTKYLKFSDVGYGRIAGPFVQPIVFGIFLPINFLFIYQAHKLGLLPRFAMWVGGAITGFLTILTFTRSVWLGAFITVLYVLYKGSAEGAAKVVRLAMFAAVAIGLVGILAMTSPEIQKRLTGEENADFRKAMAYASVNMILDKPVFGWGTGTFDDFKERYLVDAYGFYMSSKETSHVTLLTFLAELGVVGTMLLLMFIYFSVRFKGVRMADFTSDARLVAAVSIGAIITLVINAFLIDIRFFPLVWSYFFVSLGFIHNIYRTHMVAQSERQRVERERDLVTA